RERETQVLASVAKKYEYDVLYFAFLQWLMHRLLRKIATRNRILCFDLPIGCAPSGIESWLAQEKLVFSCTVGAPPDDFSPEGQNWGFHPFSPFRMRESQYEDFITLLRSNMRFARFLRLDHIMGLKRLFWIPEGKKASAGTYVEYPFRELLAILTLESVRNQVTLIGEDLGTVPRFLRSTLKRASILSTKVFYFERDGCVPLPPEKYPQKSYATLNTHDMPPLRAFLEGKDISTRLALGILTEEEASLLFADRREFITACLKKLKEWGFFDMDDVLFAFLRFLAAVPSLVVSISIDDLLESAVQLNLPGTVFEYPNWRHRMVLDLEVFKERLSQVARFFALKGGVANDRQHF
ncbi:MAG: 4-alpha-glucanotransferase, partial [Candidatus Caldatribacterium sp.]|nr:4-alpha-glucanotransferase [Candidatus Caldatribacterium sp.]